ncbi:molybdopterin-containing oxidoreductase family protein [Sphingobium subterraneum]|uniref:Formate dehydrogenase n=1 Tax=Sphingobium subterraneum TaxID=627688 RepID=A0A841J957_9SPHN|nr:molybdopterin-dependent oxidoreductase [Sphingobium subterraneum]MBB6125045.1 formate dehydrogenase [Sphingobium subterraneum]
MAAHTATPSKLAQNQSELVTYCRVCEAMCGLLATVEDGRILRVRGDPDHVYSKGHFCKKATGAVDVMYDVDRITTPLKRVGGPGEFVPVSWEDALEDITTRLADIRRSHGEDAFATFLGQPPTNGFATAIWFSAFKNVLNTKWNYAVNAEDAASLIRASEILYGSAKLLPRPDLWRTDFAIIIGANPMVSHGSVCTEPLMRGALQDIVLRGGRVVVIDPRRTETAQLFEHVALNAGTDAWFLLALLNELITAGHVDRAFIDANTEGFETLAELARPFTAERAAAECGIDADTIRNVAEGFGTAKSALIYGRTGTCTQRFGTLNNILQSLICIVTGNIDRPGGIVFPWAPFSASILTPGEESPSRVDGLPQVGGTLPSSAMINDITVPGAGQVRALMTLGGNPAHSSGASGPRMIEALGALDLHFSLDIYMNETNRHAHYILPTTTMFEREDIPFKYIAFMLRPSLFATDPIVAPPDGVREEWWIMNEICRRMGLGGSYDAPWMRRMAAMGMPIKPRWLLDSKLRMSAFGDRYGLRANGISFGKLVKDHPQGKTLRDDIPTGQLPQMLGGRKIALAPADLIEELEALTAYRPDPRFPFNLTGMREMLSMNTWLHNSATCMTAKRAHALHISSVDAEALGIADGEGVRITSEAGSLTTRIKISDRMKPGNVALPHGWGHRGGWQRANDAGGVNSNILSSGAEGPTERLAGMSILNGIRVDIEPAPAE